MLQPSSSMMSPSGMSPSNVDFSFLDGGHEEDFWTSAEGQEFVSDFQQLQQQELQQQATTPATVQPQQRNVYKVVRSSVGKKISTLKRVAVSTLQGHSSSQSQQQHSQQSNPELLKVGQDEEVFTFNPGKLQKKGRKRRKGSPPRKRKRTSRRSDAEIKEKNRLYAKQHRLDKKRQHEALVKRNEQLELENQRLRTMLASLGIGVTKKIVNAGSAPIKYGGKAVHSVGKGAFNMLFGKNQQQPALVLNGNQNQQQMMIPDPSILAQVNLQQQPQAPQLQQPSPMPVEDPMTDVDFTFDIPLPPKAPSPLSFQTAPAPTEGFIL